MERRNFIKRASIGSAALVSSYNLSALSTEKKLKIGLIGAGWYGMVVAKAALKIGGVELVAICDVDSDHLTTSADELAKIQGLRPQTFKNYLELLDFNGLEAVIIGTPPHWHALQFIAACEKGLDIYCEKPLAYEIQEGLAMVHAARKAGNIVQIGFQRRQSESFNITKRMIASGEIGNVHQITAQIHYSPGPQDNTIQAPPPSLDWEEWCGPAPKLEYRPNIGHKAWRLEKEYGNGHLVDWGIHHIDIIRHIMGETMPTEFYTTGGTYEYKNKITTPDTLTANMAFKKAPVVWQHRLWGTGDPNKEFNNGVFFHGEKATLFADDSKLFIYPAGKDEKREELFYKADSMQDKHVENFLNAVKNKDKGVINCTPEDAFQSTASVQLAMISYYTGSLVKWDQSVNAIVDNMQASRLLKREYRGKYKHP
ncbi:MAG: Gfo/Idh/MocA family oxidoreductase [Mariniphaga sp.]